MLKGIGDLAKMGNMLKQAMEMKQRIEEVKESLANERLEASAGGGMVRVELTGKMEILSVKIEAEVIDPDNPEMLETLVRAAVNDGIVQARDLAEAKMREVASGLDLPGLT